MKPRRSLFKGVGRLGKRLAWPLAAVGVIGWLFLQGRGENLSFAPPPIGGPSAQQAPETPAALSEPEPPEVIEVDGLQVKTRGALLLLNPTLVAPGSNAGINGSGFDPGARVNLLLKRSDTDKGRQLDFVLADKDGNVSGANVAIPEDWNGGPFTIIATQGDGKRSSQATGHIQPAAPQVTLGDVVGKPGDFLAMSAKGFAPDETVGIYLNSLNTEPTATFKADKSGGVGQGRIRIPFGAVGNHSLIFYGEKSQAPAVVLFTMLSLYPTATVDQYAIKADFPLSISAEGFGPSEGVRVYLNGLDTPPIAIVQTNDTGATAPPARIRIPFSLKGKQQVIMVGEKSQATSVVGFEIMPYTPVVEPSTYGGRPGTVVTFYGTGFARNETVHIRVGKTHDSPGREVSCFKTDGKGDFASAGAYAIPGNPQAGTLPFALLGAKSGGEGKAEIEVTGGSGSAQPPPAATEPFTCPLDQEENGQTPETFAPSAAARLPEPPKQGGQQQNQPNQQKQDQQKQDQQKQDQQKKLDQQKQDQKK